jgi:phosphoribosylformylglycinamidine synthase
LSEGGLAVALAEMAFAGGLGAEVDVSPLPLNDATPLPSNLLRLFSESNSRFVVEVTPENQSAFESAMQELDCYLIGTVLEGPDFRIAEGAETLIQSSIADLKSAWQTPLDWN